MVLSSDDEHARSSHQAIPSEQQDRDVVSARQGWYRVSSVVCHRIKKLKGATQPIAVRSPPWPMDWQKVYTVRGKSKLWQ